MKMKEIKLPIKKEEREEDLPITIVLDPDAFYDINWEFLAYESGYKIRYVKKEEQTNE